MEIHRDTRKFLTISLIRQIGHMKQYGTHVTQSTGNATILFILLLMNHPSNAARQRALTVTFLTLACN